MDSPRVTNPHLNAFGYDEDAAEMFGDAFITPQLPLNDDLLDSPNYASKNTAWTENQESQRGNLPVDVGSSQSPESSLQDSSSESSGKHKRNPSSNSSRSPASETDTAESNNAQANGGQVRDAMIEKSEKDMESMTMADRWFDFDSAATSPGQVKDELQNLDSSVKGISMPFTTPLNSGVSKDQENIKSRSRPPLESSASFSTIHSGLARPMQSFSRGHPAEAHTNPLRNNLSHNPAWLYNSTTPSPVKYDSTLGVQPSALDAAFATPPDSSSNPPPLLHHLTPILHPMPPKSRVETQIRVKLTLTPKLPNIKKLHIQPHQVAKLKLMAKETPPKSSDTLELYAMLVCTSAIQDRPKFLQALDRAAGKILDPGEGCCTSSGDSQLAFSSVKPKDGGPVQICEGCIKREKKRSSRKKEKDSPKDREEEEHWKQDMHKRVLVFNTDELTDWESPSKKWDKEISESISSSLPEIPFPENSMQIYLPMRITCYCRHRDEKLGFQVILTFKDHEANVIAQVVTPAIMITDDHKTHPLPTAAPHSSVYPDVLHLPEASVFSQEFLNNFNAPGLSQHHSYSTPNLQRHNTHNSLSFDGHGSGPLQHGSSRSTRRTSPFAAPQNLSQHTSATLTPHNLSRQASPSAPAGRDAKRRKASGSGRVSDRRMPDLTMTRMNTSETSNTSTPSSTSANSPLEMPTQVSDTLLAGLPNAVTNRSSNGIPDGYANMTPPGHGPVAPQSIYAGTNDVFPTSVDNQWGSASTFPLPQYNSNPPTPSIASANLYPSFHRPQSSGSLAAQQPIFSAPTSVPGSRPPSPGPHAQDHVSSRAHAQYLANSLSNVPEAVNPQMQPRILKMTPNKGPMAGGIEVTCLGRNLNPNLQIMFGDAVAMASFWGDSSIVCIAPPAVRPGAVPVTIRSHPPLPSWEQLQFIYIDTNEDELIRQTLELLNQKYTGHLANAGTIARAFLESSASSSRAAGQTGDQQRQDYGSMTTTNRFIDLETTILKCLDLMDLAESPVPASWNYKNATGQTMLHLCASLGFHRVVAGLLARGANPDSRDKNGMSPMHMASLRGHVHIVRKLVSSGGDPTMRSLRGFTPADMSSSEEILDEACAIERHTRSRSAGATPKSFHSRASSLGSSCSMRAPHLGTTSTDISDANEENDKELWSEEAVIQPLKEGGITPAQLWVRSRRNSSTNEQQYLVNPSEGELAGNARLITIMSAWRDQLATQIQQLQQYAPWFPQNLPLPNPLDYQDYPVVRRISSLVPQWQMRPDSLPKDVGIMKDSREGDTHWWEWRTRPTSSPPAYEEIYPPKAQDDLETKQASTARATGDALVDHKCEVNFDRTGEARSPNTVITSGRTGRDQTDEAKMAHGNVKGLRSDRKLFFVWIPLLILVLMAMLRDWTPQIWDRISNTVGFVYERTRITE
ncbi:MAG: hypothetical protein LQ342_004815 [Letrouitia transgressa]|nr:MAG: hypothetical protein LQ342_004815 [Letrouitia transgressa]